MYTTALLLNRRWWYSGLHVVVHYVENCSSLVWNRRTWAATSSCSIELEHKNVVQANNHTNFQIFSQFSHTLDVGNDSPHLRRIRRPGRESCDTKRVNRPSRDHLPVTIHRSRSNVDLYIPHAGIHRRKRSRKTSLRMPLTVTSQVWPSCHSGAAWRGVSREHRLLL